MKKALSVIRWVVIMLISLIGFITAPFIFPLLYPFRNTWIRNTKPFWYYFDDEDNFGFDVDWWMDGKKPSFWMAYKWCAIRNPAWNLQASLKPIKGKEEIIYHKGSLIRNNETVDKSAMAVLKYVDADGNYQDNKGEYLSLRYSIIGSMIVWFNKSNKLYWRYSLAKKILGIWIEFQIGTTQKRHTFRLKLKNKEVYNG